MYVYEQVSKEAQIESQENLPSCFLKKKKLPIATALGTALLEHYTTIYVSSYYYICPHATMYVSSYYYIPHATVCVFILLHMRVLIQVQELL
jgi:hypothetical protein